MFGECLLECFEFPEPLPWFLSSYGDFGVFFCLLKYNADERCQIDSPERSQEAACYRHPVVLPLGFCAKAGCESSSFSFLFNLAGPFFLVNHFTRLRIRYWSHGPSTCTHRYRCMHTDMSTQVCTPMQTYMYTHTHEYHVSPARAGMHARVTDNTCLCMHAHIHTCMCSTHACRCIHLHVREHTCIHRSEPFSFTSPA